MEKKLRIGVMTYWWSQDNYGQLLQAYALQEYLRQLGHEPFIIGYTNRKDLKKSPMSERILKIFNPARLINHIKYLYRERRAKMIKEPDRHFDQFRNEKITIQGSYEEWQELRDAPPEADLLIVGSDQVWGVLNHSVRSNQNLFNSYLLKFANHTAAKMSYAVSIGKSSVLKGYHHALSEELKGFDYISVREYQFANYLSDNHIAYPNCDPDPTLLLSANHYRNVLRDGVRDEIKDETRLPYVFIYIVNRYSQKMMEEIRSFAQKKNLKILYAAGQNARDNYPKLYPTIQEWLYLIDHAEYVFVNSYHGAIFSYLFHKKFLIIHKDKHQKDDRFLTLHKRLTLNDRYAKVGQLDLIDEPYSLHEGVVRPKEFELALKKIASKRGHGE